MLCSLCYDSLNCSQVCLHPPCFIQHGITCIGFRDTPERDKFCHQLDRVIRWLEEKAERQKERVMEGGGGGKQKKGRDETDNGKTTPPHKQ